MQSALALDSSAYTVSLQMLDTTFDNSWGSNTLNILSKKVTAIYE